MASGVSGSITSSLISNCEAYMLVQQDQVLRSQRDAGLGCPAFGLIEGAKAIGLGDEIGSLRVEKQADLILADLSAKSTITWNQDAALISQLVGELVTDAVDG